MLILLCEPYFSGSHRSWAEGYRDHSDHEVVLATHEGAFWKWRMHGGALTLAEESSAVLAGRRPDMVLATSMVNLPAFLGAARRDIGDAPAAIYMHESQLTYPISPKDRPDAVYPMINWSSIAVADLVIFNSEFHRASYFDGLPGLLRMFPDRSHLHMVDGVEGRSEVMAVGIDLARFDPPITDTAGSPMILWNHRWEHDKAPQGFLEAVKVLVEDDLDFRVALAGQRFVSEPEQLPELRRLLGGRLVFDGYASESDYRDLVRSSDIVISTAEQEFFGIAITEAIYAGAMPVLPNQVVFPERIPTAHHERCLYEGVPSLAAKLTWAIEHPDEARAIAAQLQPVMAAFDWSVMAPQYDARFEALVAR